MEGADDLQAFWGCRVVPGKVTAYVPPPEPESKLHVSLATLQHDTPKGATAHVMVKVGEGEPVAICALRQGQTESCSLGLLFDSYTEFEVLGKATVHLSGYNLFEGEGGHGHDHYEDMEAEEGEEDSEGEDDSEEEDGEGAFPAGKLSKRDLLDLLKGRGGAAKLHRLANADSEDDEEDEDDDELLNGMELDSDSEDEGLPTQDSGLIIEELQEAPADVIKATTVVVAEETVLGAGGAEPSSQTAQQLLAAGLDALGQAEGKEPKLSKKQKAQQKKQQAKGRKAAPQGEAPKLVSITEAVTTVAADGAAETVVTEVAAVVPEAGAAPGGTPAAGAPASLDSKSKKKREKQKEKKRKAEESTAKALEGQPVAKKGAGAKAAAAEAPEAAATTPAAKKAAPAAAPASAPGGKGNKAAEGAAAPATAAKPAKKRQYPNGFEVQTVKLGPADGKLAKAGKKVVVRYKGTLAKTGKVFDETKGKKTFSFRLGVGEVIKGWDAGVEGMRVGDKVKLTIPPQMGYGSEGATGAIPPNATLNFDVELVDVK